MPNPKSSLRKRRWEIFLREYQTNSDFRGALNQHKIRYPVGKVRRIHYQILTRYGVPAECILAIQLYLSDQSLNEDEYLMRITPPIRFLNAVANVLGPHILEPSKESSFRPESANDFVVGQLGKPLMEDLNLNEADSKAITQRIFGGFTALLVSPFTQKNELLDFINDYWDEQIKPLVNTPHADISGLSDTVERQIESLQTEKLASKVYQAGTQTNWERGELVVKLSEQGLNDDQIATKLGEAGYGSRYDSAHIRQIRYRHRRKKDVT